MVMFAEVIKTKKVTFHLPAVVENVTIVTGLESIDIKLD